MQVICFERCCLFIKHSFFVSILIDALVVMSIEFMNGRVGSHERGSDHGGVFVSSAVIA